MHGLLCYGAWNDMDLDRRWAVTQRTSTNHDGAVLLNLFGTCSRCLKQWSVMATCCVRKRHWITIRWVLMNDCRRSTQTTPLSGRHQCCSRPIHGGQAHGQHSQGHKGSTKKMLSGDVWSIWTCGMWFGRLGRYVSHFVESNPTPVGCV